MTERGGELDRHYRPLYLLEIATQDCAFGALRPGLRLGRAYSAPRFVV